jgi:3-phenylpropionate/trans-cinnamate dioxygenase ferredoxin reductase component
VAALRVHDFTGRITLVDHDPHLPYERPPLSKLSGVELRPIVPQERFAELDVELRLGDEVVDVDPATRTVTLASGHTDTVTGLLLCTGVEARNLDVPGADLANIQALRTAADSASLADRLRAGGPLVVVGGGFIGLELAALAREAGQDVTVVEMCDLPLQRLDARLGALVLELHQDRGVRFALGRTVTAFEGDGSVETVVLDDGSRLRADTVVVGVGVVPRVELAVAAGAEVDEHGIVVDDLGRTRVPWVYAAGDVASQPHPALAARGRIEHWDVAMKHGAAVGATMAGTPTPFVEEPYVWSDQFGLTFQLFGRPRETDELALRAGATPKSYLAFWVRDGRIAAVAGLDRSREVGAARRLIGVDVTGHTAALVDDTVDLRSLLKTITRG